MARIKRIPINPEAFLMIMANDTAWRVDVGVPKGAKFRGVTLDPFTQTIHIFVEHESFDSIDVMKTVAPILETKFKAIK